MCMALMCVPAFAMAVLLAALLKQPLILLVQSLFLPFLASCVTDAGIIMALLDAMGIDVNLDSLEEDADIGEDAAEAGGECLYPIE